MSDEDNITDDSDGIKSLRKAHEEAVKEAKQLREELAGFRNAQRQQTVAGVLKAKGLPESAARLYSGDDTSEEAVGKWVDEYADIFGATRSGEVDDANTKNAARVAEASYGNVHSIQNTPGVNMGDPAEIEHAIKTLPYEELEKLGYMPPRNQLFNQRR